MPGTILRTHDVYNFDKLPNPLEVGEQPLTVQDGYDQHFHPLVGALEYHNISFPHMHVTDTRWHTRDELTMIDDRPVDTINFNFQLGGSNGIQFSGFRHRHDLEAGEHYMVYHPEGEHHNTVPADTTVAVLHISMDKAFLAASLGTSDPMVADFCRAIERGQPFTSAGSLAMSPQMWHLSQTIIDNKNPGPLRNLIVQSRAMELVALHFGLLEQNSGKLDGISKGDVERLQHLKSYLDTNFLAELSLDQLSRVCLLNEFKVKKGFKQLFGMSVFNYLRKKRMDYAIVLLRDNLNSIEDVADILGYEYAHHFSAAFKKFTGISPSQMR